MADLYAVAGSKFYIGNTVALPATEVSEPSFSGETWTEVDGWETCGAIGDTAAAITTSLINSGRDIKQKGTRNAGTWENTFANMPTDAGQDKMVEAEASTSNYRMKVEWSSGEIWYFVGLVMSKSKSGGGANEVDKRNFTVEINSNIVEA